MGAFNLQLNASLNSSLVKVQHHFLPSLRYDVEPCGHSVLWHKICVLLGEKKAPGSLFSDKTQSLFGLCRSRDECSQPELQGGWSLALQELCVRGR